MSDEAILERGGTEEDIAMYAHDVGRACMYPDYPCKICEERERLKAKKILVKKTNDYVDGYNTALYDMKQYLLISKTDLDNEVLEQIVIELKIPNNDKGE